MSLISHFFASFGVSFLIYKLISVSVATFGLIAIYYFIKEVANKRVALLTTFLSALSFWYLVWARLGNYNILTPIITALMMYFFITYIKKQTIKWLTLSIFTSCLGLFTYAGIFLLPFILLALLLVEMVIRKKALNGKRLIAIIFLFLPGFLLFSFLVFHDLNNFTNGYIGTKLFDSEASTNEIVSRILVNVGRTITMLHVEGDIVFRWNISKAPLLDWLSGIFFIIGFIYCIIKEKKFLPYLLIPLLLLPIPSILPSHPPVEIPSSSRTMPIIPFVFLFVAYGVDYFIRFIKERLGTMWGWVALAVSLLLISFLNLYNYFVLYPKQLPNKNVSFGREIAEYIDTQPISTPVYLASLGWGEWGQPSSDSIYYSLKNKKRILVNGLPSCNESSRQSFIVILDPTNIGQVDAIKKCYPYAKAGSHETLNQMVFRSLINQ